MHFALTNCLQQAKNLNSAYYNKFIGPFTLFYQNDDEVFESQDYIGIVQGYVRNFNFQKDDIKGQVISAFESITYSWPLSSRFTGSFSILVINKNNLNVYLCNDPIGVYPLHYSLFDDGLIVSNSLQLFGKLANAEIDHVGVAEALFGPENSCIGSRTLLKNCKRLLPGEWILRDYQTQAYTCRYDNTLYQDINEDKNLKTEEVLKFWELLKKELDYAIGPANTATIALSGGMDSRILLAAMPEDKTIHALTYGEKDNYETKVAKQLAQIKGANFHCFGDYEFYFPDSAVLKDYLRKTEAVYVTNWLSITEKVDTSLMQKPFFEGDMCEILPGRNIRCYNSRSARIKSFWNNYVLGQKYEFTDRTENYFKKWARDKSTQYIQTVEKSFIANKYFENISDSLLECIRNDLEEIFNRIKAHYIPYNELNDEIFAWFTHARLPMGKQILTCNYHFQASSPSMSIAILRKASSIHPNKRLNYRFIRKLFRDINPIKPYIKVPTNQAPLIPQDLPSPIVFALWGFRSKFDQFLIKRMLRNRNPHLKYRSFRAFHIPFAYQQEIFESRIISYFKPNLLGQDMYETARKKFLNRKQMNDWPLANNDIISIASTNQLLILIKENNML